MSESPTGHLQDWARDILADHDQEYALRLICRYRAKALDPVVDPFSRRDFKLRAKILEQQLDRLTTTADPPASS